MKLRSTVVTAAVSAAAALAATGITYASAASASAPQEVPAAVAAATGGNGGNGNGNSKGNEGNNSKGNEGKSNEGKSNDRDDDNEGRGEDEGRIQINERSYSTHPGDCITVVSGLGAETLNVRNESRKAVEVFRGAVCDNGAPIATVGPHSSSYGVDPGCVDGIDIDEGVVASFRVVKRHHDEY
ncbi:hypothetical protein [Streptomyces collinus]|uniref:hypothetical protein n=1 Tax=Streptomyces collinus TaxID=42684 RepID=UPI002941FEA1|nr:hypothetical protein [Streptomyces collinus]